MLAVQCCKQNRQSSIRPQVQCSALQCVLGALTILVLCMAFQENEDMQRCNDELLDWLTTAKNTEANLWEACQKLEEQEASLEHILECSGYDFESMKDSQDTAGKEVR